MGRADRQAPPASSDDQLHVPLRHHRAAAPFDSALSFGDLIIAVGLCDLAFHASRKRKPRGLPHTNGSATEPRVIDLANFAEPRPTATTPAANALQPAEFVLSPTARLSALSTRSS